MRRHELVVLMLLLTAGIHADWHFARPHHYRLSLEWSQHWIFAAVLFASLGCYIARRVPDESSMRPS